MIEIQRISKWNKSKLDFVYTHFKRENNEVTKISDSKFWELYDKSFDPKNKIKVLAFLTKNI